jgi:hypothetical protein
MKVNIWQMIFLSGWVLSVSVCSAYGNPPEVTRRFQTDGCTAYREGPSSYPNQWRHCCIYHDFHYWAGGSKDDRREVDRALLKCVSEAGSVLEAKLIFLGVKVGGSSPIKITGKQWGNAWGNQVRRSALTVGEVKDLEESLQEGALELEEKDRSRLLDELRFRAHSPESTSN